MDEAMAALPYQGVAYKKIIDGETVKALGKDDLEVARLALLIKRRLLGHGSGMGQGGS